MFSLAHLAFHRLRGVGVPERTVLDTLQLFDETCVALTEGQYLDMVFESRLNVTLAEYFQMIAAKTGALLAASPQIGSLVAEAPAAQASLYGAFGAAFGRAFQLQDDLLGIWGDEAVTGKSAVSDILSKKKSLPVIYAFAHPTIGSLMSGRYAGPAFAATDVPAILTLLDESGAQSYVENQVRISVADAHRALSSLQPTSDRVFLDILAELVDSLVERTS
jgi:geranylgeranyl diphosphate synthase type I